MIERAVISTQGTALRLGDNLDDFQPANLSLTEAKSLIEIGCNHIIKTLEAANRKIEGPNGAAPVLSLNASTLRTRMKNSISEDPSRPK